MSLNENIPKDFFKQFKNKEEFHSFFNDLFKQGVEEMLKAELEATWVMKNIAKMVMVPEIVVMEPAIT